MAEHVAGDLLKNPLKYLEAIIGQAKELQAALQDVVASHDELVEARLGDAISVARLAPLPLNRIQGNFRCVQLAHGG